MSINIPNSDKKRVVIIGSGFAGLKLARKLNKSNFQVILIDKNNFHQFQPLLYQVSTAGLEPSSIAFPLRKIFQHKKDIIIRVAEVTQIIANEKKILTTLGPVKYDYLVIASGADTSFFGLRNVQKYALPMKSVSEAICIRNAILQNFEDALSINDIEALEGYFNIVIVGGGPTGVEVSGALAEMRKYVLPKDFPELDCSKIQIYIIEASTHVLSSMSEQASKKAQYFLQRLGINVITSTHVSDYDGKYIHTNKGLKIRTNTIIWAAGIAGNLIDGLNPEYLTPSGRIKVDQYNAAIGYEYMFAIGDIACIIDEKHPKGHPQVAQVAIQQAVNLGSNLINIQKNKAPKPFIYKNLGSMATIGRNLAVVDFPFARLQGWFAWFVWMFVHLMAIVGVKNKIFIFINWLWNYISYDQSLRLIIRQKNCKYHTLAKAYKENCEIQETETSQRMTDDYKR